MYKNKKIGLYFGSFNPIHIGHMAIANYMIEFTDLDELWFVITPQNPFKVNEQLLNDYDRLELLKIAINNDPRFSICDIEFYLPKPSYTIDTLTYLEERYKNRTFVLIMGSDNLPQFHKWKNYKIIEEKYSRYIYPRPGFQDIDLTKHKNIKVFDAPLMDISSTFIREAIKQKKDIRYFLPHGVYEEIDRMNYYRK